MALATTAMEVRPAYGAGQGGGQEHGHSEHPPSSTGLDSRKLLMWAFLTSDTMFFGSLIATYMNYRGRSEALDMPPYPQHVFDVPYTSVSAFVLLMSSLTMVLALAAIQRGNYRGLRVWLAATALLGAIFVGGQVFEFTTFYHEGLTLQGNMFGASFFVLTGFHGAHVTIGVLWLLCLLFVSFRGAITPANALNVEIAGLYWHFVDIVWIIIFGFVYLMPYPSPHEPAQAAMQLLQSGAHLLQTLPFS